MSDEIKKNEIEEIGEEELEKVSGGVIGNRSTKCYFEPEVPYKWKAAEPGYIWVKCKMNCQGFLTYCHCHGGDRCGDRYHKMKEGSKGVWTPYPADGWNNHLEAGKRVHLDVASDAT